MLSKMSYSTALGVAWVKWRPFSQTAPEYANFGVSRGTPGPFRERIQKQTAPIASLGHGLSNGVLGLA